MKKIAIICLALLSAYFSKAQTDELKWNVGFYGGLINYNGDRGQNFYNYASKQAAYGFGGVSVSRYISRHFEGNLFFTKGEIGNMQVVSAWSTPKDAEFRHFLIRTNTATLNLQANILGPQYHVRPFIYAGAGIMVTEDKYTSHKQRLDYALPSFGAGVNFRFNDYVNLKIQESFIYASTDELDRTVHGAMDGFLYHTAGLTFNFGKKPDADMDGVSDKKDMCTNTPKGVTVDMNGCPLDKDKDGIADYIDNCPDVAGVASLNGCPDADKDGITDAEDRCPNSPGSIEHQGCPDTDNDGVVDIDDKCPGTKAGYKIDATGCPLDNDKDGIVNEEDHCPNAAGIASLGGCPDSDGDGIADDMDHCPDAKGSLQNNGCPEIPKAVIQQITVIASKIYFETGSDKLKLESQTSLDELVSLLNKYPAAKLSIEGHTDDVGDNDYNMTLSQKRTESVKNYLISKGISESRLTAIGFGETMPIADNKTKVGRSKNRRVELHTSY
jgi:OOP family OmpA-OmpF porin